MSKLVILKFGEGNFEQGFSVTLQIGKEEEPLTIQELGKLPPNTEITQFYETWWLMYINISKSHRALEKRSGQITNVSTIKDCKEAGEILSKNLNNWLYSREFVPIQNKLRENLTKSDLVRILLETNNIQLQRLPWYEWDLLANYRQAEIAISPPRYEKVEQPVKSIGKIKILAILGDSNGINIEEDRQQLLENLPDTAKINFLVNPQFSDINNQLWDEGWDILFFAGHSETQSGTGKIYINPNESLTISELKFALITAIERGLKIAIFNSCDGLGLARDLTDLQIPQIIVMRERVPDKVAQEFLKYFLKEFYQNESFYLAVRKARERLQGLEKEYPCASWLPIIYQNPAYKPPKWQDLIENQSSLLPKSLTQSPQISKTDSNTARDRVIRTARNRVSSRNPVSVPAYPSSIETDSASKLSIKKRRSFNFLSVLFASLFATVAVVGVRQKGLLERLELIAFDQLMQLRPQEKADDRILIVKADEQDIHKYGFPLPDGVLAKTISKLDQHQPQVIGLDIFRNVPREPGYAQLAKHFQKNQRLIAVCRVPDVRDSDNPGIAPPKAIAAEGVGFADAILDSDGVLRRHLLFLTPEENSVCTSTNSFSILLALNYLADKGIQPLESSEKRHLKLDSMVFTPLPYEGRAGGYSNINGEGTQILLNYRATKDVTQIAKTVTLSKVINGQIKREDVENRIVIVGVTDRTAGGDFINTPYGEIPGVLVQAHGVSQILSTVLDRPRRPLLKVWSLEAEIFWIWGWSLVGGVLLWRWRSPFFFLVTVSTATAVMAGLCLFLLINGSWAPLVPSALALIMTSFCVVIYQPNERK
jgi:CHASE2 domain-containing sensor protein